MSMTKCEECERLIDSDDDPDCFVDMNAKKWDWAVLCEWCREDEEILRRLRQLHAAEQERSAVARTLREAQE